MTVAELISLLQQQPQNAEVYRVAWSEYDGRFCQEVESVVMSVATDYPFWVDGVVID